MQSQRIARYIFFPMITKMLLNILQQKLQIYTERLVPAEVSKGFLPPSALINCTPALLPHLLLHFQFHDVGLRSSSLRGYETEDAPKIVKKQDWGRRKAKNRAGVMLSVICVMKTRGGVYRMENIQKERHFTYLLRDNK